MKWQNLSWLIALCVVCCGYFNRCFDFYVLQTVAHPEHILKGRTIDPKRAVAEGSKELNSKIFVGGIDPNMGKDEIVEAFSKFGEVTFDFVLLLVAR